jgi:hypothetical protein
LAGWPTTSWAGFSAADLYAGPAMTVEKAAPNSKRWAKRSADGQSGLEPILWKRLGRNTYMAKTWFGMYTLSL